MLLQSRLPKPKQCTRCFLKTTRSSYPQGSLALYNFCLFIILLSWVFQNKNLRASNLFERWSQEAPTREWRTETGREGSQHRVNEYITTAVDMGAARQGCLHITHLMVILPEWGKNAGFYLPAPTHCGRHCLQESQHFLLPTPVEKALRLRTPGTFLQKLLLYKGMGHARGTLRGTNSICCSSSPLSISSSLCMKPWARGCSCSGKQHRHHL